MDLQQKRPEMGAGSYSRDDTTIAFYLRVNALISGQSAVLDLGAGRGAGLETADHFPRSLSRLKGRVAWLSGCDVDDAVLQNEHLDDRRILDPNGPLPYEDATFDLVYSDWVIEHIADVDSFVSEVGRVLKPGGWFCAWTPNKWGYVGIGARLVPNALHAKVLKRAQPAGRGEKDVFPTVYRMNTLGDVGRCFPEQRFENFSFGYNAQPSYNFGSTLVARMWLAYMALTPRWLAQSLFVFLRKREAQA